MKAIILTVLLIGLGATSAAAQTGSWQLPRPPGSGMPGTGMPDDDLLGPLGPPAPQLPGATGDELPLTQMRCAQAMPEIQTMIEKAEQTGQDMARARGLLADAELMHRAGDERACLDLAGQAHRSVMSGGSDDIPFPVLVPEERQHPRAYRRAR